MKIRSFEADCNLLRLIQATTKRSPANILSYFYNNACITAEKSLSKSEARIPSRKITTYFPDTCIPFTMTIWYHSFFTDKVVSCTVNFPNKKYKTYTNIDKLVDEVAEACLLGNTPPSGEDFPALKHVAPVGMGHLKNKGI